MENAQTKLRQIHCVLSVGSQCHPKKLKKTLSRKVFLKSRFTVRNHIKTCKNNFKFVENVPETLKIIKNQKELV